MIALYIVLTIKLRYIRHYTYDIYDIIIYDMQNIVYKRAHILCSIAGPPHVHTYVCNINSHYTVYGLHVCYKLYR